MKLKVIVGIALATALCSQTYALQITKGKLISHKQWTTNGAIGKFLPGKKTLQSVQHKTDIDDPNDLLPVGLFSVMQSVNTTVGTPVDIANNALIYVTNNTSQVRDYNYNIVTCAATETPDTTECVQYFDVISLEPNGSFWDSVSPVLTMNYKTAGTYNTYAGTYYSAVDHDDTGTDPGESGASSSSATITVS